MHETVMGIDVGGTKTAAVVMSAPGSVLSTRWIERAEHADPIAAIPDLVRDLESATGSTIRCIGLSIAGLVSAGRVWEAATLGITDRDLPAEVTALTGLPTAVINDASAALLSHLACRAIAEGADAADAVPARTVVLLALGTGVGGAVALDGRILDSATVELGHLPIAPPGGELCVCGSSGCLEQVAGGMWIGRRASRSRGVATSARNVVDAAVRDELWALEILDEVGQTLGAAICAIAPVLDPAEIVLTGSFGHAAAPWLIPAALERMAAQWPFARWRAVPELTVHSVGPTAAALGAAAHAEILFSRSTKGTT